MTKHVHCCVGENCSDDGKAMALAPQLTTSMDQSFSLGPYRFRYVPVCAAHLDGWWMDGDPDEVEPEFRPPTVMLP